MESKINKSTIDNILYDYVNVIKLANEEGEAIMAGADMGGRI